MDSPLDSAAEPQGAPVSGSARRLVPRPRRGGSSAPKKQPGKAGRNLPAAIGVGLFLGLGLVLLPLLVWPPAFVVILVAAVGVGMWEIARAVSHAHVRVPLVPTFVAGLALPVVAYLYHGAAMAMVFVLGCLAVLVLRVALGVHEALRDVAGGVLTLAYVALLASFCALMLSSPQDGHLQVLVFIMVTVCSDIGGYAVGVLKGKHPMAPSISPKKSWEGFGGSVLTCALVGALAVALLLHGPWWVGALLGVATAGTATVGDLCESVIKRDIGIKDMGHLLPGHGGLMDRLDSLLVVAPMAWLVLAHLLPQIGPR